MEQQFKAIVVGEASKLINKNNESGKGAYVLHNCEVLDGPLQGKVVTGSRTLVNASGADKSGVNVGDEVTLHMTIVSDDRGVKPFFEIQKGAMTSSDEDILAAIGYKAETQTI